MGSTSKRRAIQNGYSPVMIVYCAGLPGVGVVIVGTLVPDVGVKVGMSSVGVVVPSVPSGVPTVGVDPLPTPAAKSVAACAVCVARACMLSMLTVPAGKGESPEPVAVAKGRSDAGLEQAEMPTIIKSIAAIRMDGF